MRNPPSQSRDSSRSKDEPDIHEIKEENLDKTIADSFPASDPPSSLPNPEVAKVA